MSPSEILDLIQYHKDALSQHRPYMNRSSIYLVEQTIKALEELLHLKGGTP